MLIVPKTSKTYQPRWTDYVINWGCSTEWNWINRNKKSANTLCVNKLDFFTQVDFWNAKAPDAEMVNIPEWTTDPEIVKDWVNSGSLVLARTKLNGHSGAGIILVDPPYDVITYAPLYVKYKKKRHEYRVHVFNGEVIDVTQKRKRKGAEHLDTKIRNHQNGWVYCRENIEEPYDLRTQAINAMSAVGLQFGAVDIIWNEKEDKSYVLEINCAPGLEGTSLTKYVDAFVKDMQK